MNRRKKESILQMFERKNRSPADQEWQGTDDSKAAVDETPRQRDATEMASD
jgi:hypothetical protein